MSGRPWLMLVKPAAFVWRTVEFLQWQSAGFSARKAACWFINPTHAGSLCREMNPRLRSFVSSSIIPFMRKPRVKRQRLKSCRGIQHAQEGSSIHSKKSLNVFLYVDELFGVKKYKSASDLNLNPCLCEFFLKVRVFSSWIEDNATRIQFNHFIFDLF